MSVGGEVDGSQTWAIRPVSRASLGSLSDLPSEFTDGTRDSPFEDSTGAPLDDPGYDSDTLRPRGSRSRRGERQLAYKPSFVKPKFQWIRGEILGRGSYGTVYLALNATTGEIIAVKQVELPKTANDRANSQQMDVMKALKFESDTLSDLDHPNIVSYLGYEESAEYLSIFLEYVPGGTISALLREHGRLREEVTKSFLVQILRGLEYLHSKSIIHRDLKADNILVTPTGVCKISDFGISKRANGRHQGGRTHTMMRGTIYWMAPEVVSSGEEGYDVKVDIWGVGCVALEMWSGSRPWGDLPTMPVMYKLYTDKMPPPVPEDVHLSELAEDFRMKCFQADPKNRPHARVLKNHEYLQSHKTLLFDITDVADTKEPPKAPPIQYSPDVHEGKVRTITATPTSRSKTRSTSTRKDRSGHVEPKASRAAPKPPLTALKIPEYIPPRNTAHVTSNLKLETTVSPSKRRTTQRTPTRPATSPNSQNGPRLVYITPPGSPKSRATDDSWGMSAFGLPSASEAYTPRRGKSRRLIVINPDPDSHQPSFVYTPPPLPDPDATPSSAISPKSKPPRWREPDTPTYAGLVAPGTSPPPSSAISSGPEPSPIHSAASARSPRPLPPSPAAPIPMPSTSISFKSVHSQPRLPLSSTPISSASVSSRLDHHDISGNTAYRAAHVQRHPTTVNGKTTTSPSIRRLPISPPQLKTSNSIAHLPSAGGRSLMKQKSVPDVSIFSSFGRTGGSQAAAGHGVVNKTSPTVLYPRSFSLDESDLEFDDLDTNTPPAAPPVPGPSSATTPSQIYGRPLPEKPIRTENSEKPVNGFTSKGKAENRMTLRPKMEDVYEDLQTWFPDHNLEQTVDIESASTPVTRSPQTTLPVGEVSSSRSRHTENRKSIKMIAKEKSRRDPGTSRRTRLWNSEVMELKAS